MGVIYRNSKIEPAPFFNISKEFQRTADGTIIGSTYRLTAQGQMMAWRGSPTSSGTFWTDTGSPPDESIASDARLKSILRKQEAIRSLFSQDGYVLEIQPWDFSSPIKCQPRVVSIDFPDGLWFEVCPYTITFETDNIQGIGVPSGEDSFGDYINSAQEDWGIEFADQYQDDSNLALFRLTHTLSAVGKRYYDPALGAGPGSLSMPAWQQARSWVQARLGIDTTRINASGTLNLPSFMQGFNHVRSENADYTAGTYSVNESWLVASGSATEDFTVDVKSNINEGVTQVSIQGSIQGLESRSTSNWTEVTQTKYEAALAKFNSVSSSFITRAQNYGGATLNATPLDYSIGKNPVNGVITYNYSYDTRPSNCIAGARSEQITITEEYASDVFAVLPVLGRAIGPVLQSIGTVTETKRSLSVEVVMNAVTGCNYSAWSGGRPNYTSVIAAAAPVASQVFISSNTESWNPKTGHGNRQISWTYQ